jgi:hypothetical protein
MRASSAAAEAATINFLISKHQKRNCRTISKEEQQQQHTSQNKPRRQNKDASREERERMRKKLSH